MLKVAIQQSEGECFKQLFSEAEVNAWGLRLLNNDRTIHRPFITTDHMCYLLGFLDLISGVVKPELLEITPCRLHRTASLIIPSVYIREDISGIMELAKLMLSPKAGNLTLACLKKLR